MQERLDSNALYSILYCAGTLFDTPTKSLLPSVGVVFSSTKKAFFTGIYGSLFMSYACRKSKKKIRKERVAAHLD